VGKRLCTAFVTLSAVQRRYWRIKPKLKRPLRLGFLTTARAPASTSAALRRWRTEQTKRHDALEESYRELYRDILERIQDAAVLLKSHTEALLAFFEAIRLAEQSRIQALIAELPRGDERRSAARAALKRLHVGSRRLNHFRKAPSQLFPTWKQDWLLPRQALLAMLEGQGRTVG
jgi:hypothetical protein